MGFEQTLIPDKALIFRVTHRQNLPWTLDNGLCCSNHPLQDPAFVRIGNEDLIGSRHTRQVPIPPGGTLADYVPFYFTPYSMMLYNIITGMNVKAVPRNDLAILVSSLRNVAAQGVPFVFTDRHAYLFNASFQNDLTALDRMVPWELLQRRDFSRDPQNPEKTDRYQAEALIHSYLPVEALSGIVTYSDAVQADVEAMAADCHLDLRVISRPNWFF